VEAAAILHANLDDFVTPEIVLIYDSSMCHSICVFLAKVDIFSPETRHFEADFSLTMRSGFQSGKRVPLALLTLLVLSLSIIGWLLYHPRSPRTEHAM